MTDRELIQLALDVVDGRTYISGSILNTLRARLSQPEQEPVAWLYEFWVDSGYKGLNFKPQKYADNTPLYTAPPSIEAAVKAEREACAKVCEELAVRKRFQSSYEEGFADGSDVCANAIRARG